MASKRFVKWFYLTLSAFLVFLLIIVLALWMMLQDKPLVSATSHEQLKQADSLAPLRTQLIYAYRLRESHQQLKIADYQVNSVFGTFQRANKRFRGQALIRKTDAEIALSYQLPERFGHWFLNIQVLLNEGTGINIQQFSIGSLSLPGNYMLRLVAWVFDSYTDERIAADSLKSVTKIDFHRSNVVVTLKPFGNLIRRLKILGAQNDNSNKELAARVSYYLTFLSSNKLPAIQERLSSTAYLSLLFKEVSKQSVDKLPEKENEAAILALAIFDGSPAFGKFVGDVQPKAGQKAKPNNPMTLSRRRDLHLHFIFSAALEILSNNGLTFAIGELKELVDSGANGSGFSFIDLTADMAGAKLTRVLLDSKSAKSMQEKLAMVTDESEFFPSLSGLTEGLTKKEFAAQYEHVESEAYKTLLNDIRSRIDALPIYH
jgi:uncharacterized protein YpmS